MPERDICIERALVIYGILQTLPLEELWRLQGYAEATQSAINRGVRQKGEKK